MGIQCATANSIRQENIGIVLLQTQMERNAFGPFYLMHEKPDSLGSGQAQLIEDALNIPFEGGIYSRPYVCSFGCNALMITNVRNNGGPCNFKRFWPLRIRGSSSGRAHRA